MTIRYTSTRGGGETYGLREVVLQGLAPDGGLFVPVELPPFSEGILQSWKALSYAELAAEVMAPFFETILTKPELLAMARDAYDDFDAPDIAPLKDISGIHMLELFHGPTLAFKDFALQFLGRVIEFLLTEEKQTAIVLGATSGDTGSAAIAGFKGRGQTQIFILHPHGRTSDVQRQQMTTATETNVHNIAIKGTFDDCQDIVKALFGDADLQKRGRLIAVNSINWLRILAQTVYYIYAALKLGAPEREVDFTVPTGNFGNILAGHYAKTMGLPIGTLVIASNENDVLTRALEEGVYAMRGVHPTLSPSMDIEISSNFERLLYELLGKDSSAMRQGMQGLRETRALILPEAAQEKFRDDFAAMRVTDAETLAEIKQIYHETNEPLDPHTAVGMKAAKAKKGNNPMVLLATAHPAKFAGAVKQAVGFEPPVPPPLAALERLPERYDILEAKKEDVKQFIQERA